MTNIETGIVNLLPEGNNNYHPTLEIFINGVETEVASK